MTRIRSQNRQLQIDIDCTLKETDLLQSRGKNSMNVVIFMTFDMHCKYIVYASACFM